MVLVLALAAVAGAATAGASPAQRRAPVDVVTAFYPLTWAVEQVGGRAVRVDDLTPAGVEPHDLELTTDARDAIQDADLVVVMGRGFQVAVEEAAADRDSGTLQVLRSIHVDGSRAARDPHVWLDPVLMGRIVDDVERALAKVDPARAGTYARRARAARARVLALDADYRAGLASCTRHVIVTAHEAFGWLASRYGLRQQGIAGIDPEAEPDPRHLADLTDLVERTHTTTIFTESLVSPKVAETLAREAGGVRTRVLDPLESLARRDRTAGRDYVDVMRRNLTKLRAALDCA